MLSQCRRRRRRWGSSWAATCTSQETRTTKKQRARLRCKILFLKFMVIRSFRESAGVPAAITTL